MIGINPRNKRLGFPFGQQFFLFFPSQLYFCFVLSSGTNSAHQKPQNPEEEERFNYEMVSGNLKNDHTSCSTVTGKVLLD